MKGETQVIDLTLSSDAEDIENIPPMSMKENPNKPEDYNNDTILQVKEAVLEEEGEFQSSYTNQVQTIISTVLKDESHLFNPLELKIIYNYQSLDMNTQELYFRLLMREVKPIRVQSLVYKSIKNVKECIHNLQLSNPPFVESPSSSSDSSINSKNSNKNITENAEHQCTHLIQFLKRTELDSIAKKRQIKSSKCTIQELQTKILKSCKSQRELFGNQSGQGRLLKEMQGYLGELIQLASLPRTVFMRLSIIYARDTEFPAKPFLDSILSNLVESSENKRVYPEYKVQRVGNLWPSRQDCVDYVVYLEMLNEMSIQMQNKEFSTMITTTQSLIPVWKDIVIQGQKHVTGIDWFQCFTSGWILTRILNLGAHAYFRRKKYPEQAQLLQLLLSQTLYCPAKRGSWFDDYFKITDLYIDKTRAQEICLEALKDEFVIGGRRASIQKRGLKVFKNCEIPRELEVDLESRNIEDVKQYSISGTKIISRNRGKSQWKDGDEIVTVEQFALNYYARQGWKGIHAEASIITSLFGLLFWDILFQDKLGAFESCFQIAPLDLGTVYFFESRREDIEARVEEIIKGKYKEIVTKVDEQERPRNTRCIGVSWRSFTLSDLLEIMDCMGGQTLGQLCLKFAKRYWTSRGGIPDLCLWKPESNEFKLVEIKGQGDVLSEKQKLWLNLLHELNVEAEILHVLNDSES